MMNDTVLKDNALKILTERLGRVDAERFVSLIIKEPFDYTQWHRGLFGGMSVREISNAAKNYCDKQNLSQ